MSGQTFKDNEDSTNTQHTDYQTIKTANKFIMSNFLA